MHKAQNIGKLLFHPKTMPNYHAGRSSMVFEAANTRIHTRKVSMQIMLDPQKDKQQNYDKLGVQTFLPTQPVH